MLSQCRSKSFDSGRKQKEVLSMEHPDSFSGTSQKIMMEAQIEWGKLLYASGNHHDAMRHMPLGFYYIVMYKPYNSPPASMQAIQVL